MEVNVCWQFGEVYWQFGELIKTARQVIVYILLFPCLIINYNICNYYCRNILQRPYAFIAAYAIFEDEKLSSN